MGDPELSIVAAGVDVGHTLRSWLDAIAPQAARCDAEVLVAVDRRDEDVATADSSAGANVLIVPGGDLVPTLWSAVLARARGRIVAVTITSCVPAPDWTTAILEAHRTVDAAGIGGTIDVAADATLVDRAVHLVRYSAYLPPMASGPVAEIAADNASYRRSDLEPALPVIRRDGFWETDFHREVRARHRSLWLDPRVRVVHRRSYSFRAFSQQRFVHGRRFGRTRRDEDSRFVRVARVPSSAVVPAVMLARIVRNLVTRSRLDGRTLAALPLVLWFLVCWAAGEAIGQFDE